MLSYDPPATVNGQVPPITTDVAADHQAATNPAKAARVKSSRGPATSNIHHIWLVTGPAGCGKSTVAKHLADSLCLPYIEGDEFHPPANVQKMSSGIPLTDADRWDWLTALREESIRQLNAGQDGVVLTCSALKRKYRDVIRVAPYFMPNVHLHFIFLYAPEEVLLSRVMARQNHYMGANMVHSQFDILEVPANDEIDVLAVDVTRTVEEVKTDVLDRVLHAMDEVEAAP